MRTWGLGHCSEAGAAVALGGCSFCGGLGTAARLGGCRELLRAELNAAAIVKARGGCSGSEAVVVAASSSPCRRVPASARLGGKHIGGNVRSVSLCRHLVVPPCRRRVVVAASSPSSSSSSSRRRPPLSSPPGPHHQCWSSRCRVIRPRLYPVAVAVVGWSSSPLVAARRCGSSSPLVAASSRGLHKCIHIGIHTSIHIGYPQRGIHTGHQCWSSRVIRPRLYPHLTPGASATAAARLGLQRL